MGVDGNAILAGILGGVGGFGTQVGGAMEAQRQEALARDKLRQEQEYRDAMVTLERDKVAQSGPIDVSALPPQIQTLLAQAGAPAKIDPRAMPFYQKAGDEARLRSQGGQVANEIEGLFPPNDVQGPTRSGDPIGPQPTIPTNVSMLVKMLRSGMIDNPKDMIAQIAQKPELKEVQGEGGATYYQPFNPMTGAPVPGGQRTLKAMGPLEMMAWLNNGGKAPDSAPGGPAPQQPKIQFVPSIGKEGVSFKGDAEPPNYQYVRGMLADAGWQPGMKGYDTEFATQLQQPVPVPDGGKATSRSEGIRPPAFYGNQGAIAGSPGAMPGAEPSQPRFRGEPKAANETAAKDVLTAVQMRGAVNQIGQALKDPTTADYIGPYAQYRDTVQGKAPNEMLGKIPPAVVQLDANLHALQNYTIRLITGAQMNKDEVPRIMGQLPQRGNQADEFRQRVKITMDNVSMMENQIRSLALQGDTNAKALAAELGLNQFREVQAPGVGGRDFSVNPAARPLPKLQPGERLEGGEIISESGQYVWRGGQWLPR